jgi:lipoprotein-anchoring transpeptidase ErfK/SrfK
MRDANAIKNKLAMIGSMALVVAILFAIAAAAQQPSETPLAAAEAALSATEPHESQPPLQASMPQTAAPPDEPQREIVISIPDRKLALLEGGEVVKVYTVAVGKASSPSPRGEFKIVNRLVSPTFYHPGVVIPAGPDNPLGTRWIGLNKKGLGIHGTNEPRSIGKAASHGCVRMRRADVEELFALVRAGDTVVIRAERDELVSEVFGGDEPQPAKQTNDAQNTITVADAGAAPQMAPPASGN